MSLYLKYRPNNFKTVVGQEHAKQTIQNAIKKGNLSHAYLFCGPRGTGKTSLARILAKALNCLNPEQGEPCNECDICNAINTGRLVDLIEIEAASNRGIDEIRDLREKIVFAPSQARAKVYIIDEVHMLTKEAFNALLKTLEEPPSHAYFVLATTEAHKIPETIVSRCQQFNFNRINVNDTVKRLEMIAKSEGVDAENEALELIAKISNGGLRDAIGLFEQMTQDNKIKVEVVADNLGLTGSIFLERIFDSLIQKNPLKAIEILSQVNALGKNLNQFVSEFIAYLREQMLINLGNSTEVKALIRFIEIFTQAKEQMSQAIIPQLPLEVAMIKACDYESSQAAFEAQDPKTTDKKSESRVGEVISSLFPGRKSSSKTKEDDNSLNIQVIKELWPKVIEKIKTPFIRISLMDGEPVAFEEGKLLVKFNSSILMEKIEKSSNQVVVQKVFEEIYGTKIELKCEVKKVTLNPVEPKVERGAGDYTVVEMAEEVFGIK